MKKGIEMQFHWIFVLIAGAIILAFFFSVVQKQRAYAEERVAIRLSADVEAVFSGAIESKGTVQFLPTPQPGLSFSCTGTCECLFGIGQKSTSFREKIMFAPGLLKDDEIVTWALEWKQPFRVTNFLYLTNQKIKYYLVYKEGLSESNRLFSLLTKALPPEVNMEVLNDPAQLENVYPAGWQETKLVFVFIDPGDYMHVLPDEWADERISAVRLSPPHVEFWTQEEGTTQFVPQSSLLAGAPTWYAAMFSADKTMYDCGIEAAFTRLAHVGTVIKERTEAVSDALQPRCTYFTDRFDDLITAAEEVARGNAQALGNIGTYVEELDQQNKRMIQESCPEMY